MTRRHARFGYLAVASLVLLAACNTDTSESGSEHCGQGASCMTTTPPITAAVVTARRLTSQIVAVEGLQFTLPRDLVYRSAGGSSAGETMEGFYGNFALSSSCANGCPSSFGQLPANGVVVGVGVTTRTTFTAEAPNTSIAGRAATYVVDRPGICGGNETVTVRVPTDAVDYVVRACLTGPDLAVGERIVRAVVDSASFPRS